MGQQGHDSRLIIVPNHDLNDPSPNLAFSSMHHDNDHLISDDEVNSGGTELIVEDSIISGDTVVIADISADSRDTEPIAANSPAPANSFSMPDFSNAGSREDVHSEPAKSDSHSLQDRVSELELENAEQRMMITSLQQGLNSQSAMLTNLQQLLSKRFGSAFASLGPPSSSQSPFNRVTAAEAEASLNQYIAAPTLNADESREKRRRIDEQRKRKPEVIILKNSDQNTQSANHPVMYIKPMAEIEGDVYGDRSGILVWGFEEEFGLWFVKRNSLKMEYYKNANDFSSFTVADLAELVDAPYHDKSKNAKAWNLKKHLENQKKVGFSGMKTAKSFLKKSSQINPVTQKPIYHVKWPKTNQVRQVPIKKALPDGSLDTLVLWTYDEATSTAVIKTKHNSIRMVDVNNLFMFRERDIKRLAETEMVTDKSVFVPAAKQFVKRVKEIVEQKSWFNELERSDVNVLYVDS